MDKMQRLYKTYWKEQKAPILLCFSSIFLIGIILLSSYLLIHASDTAAPPFLFLSDILSAIIIACLCVLSSVCIGMYMVFIFPDRKRASDRSSALPSPMNTYCNLLPPVSAQNSAPAPLMHVPASKHTLFVNFLQHPQTTSSPIKLFHVQPNIKLFFCLLLKIDFRVAYDEALSQEIGDYFYTALRSLRCSDVYELSAGLYCTIIATDASEEICMEQLADIAAAKQYRDCRLLFGLGEGVSALHRIHTSYQSACHQLAHKTLENCTQLLRDQSHYHDIILMTFHNPRTFQSLLLNKDDPACCSYVENFIASLRDTSPSLYRIKKYFTQYMKIIRETLYIKNYTLLQKGIDEASLLSKLEESYSIEDVEKVFMDVLKKALTVGSTKQVR